MHVVGLGGTIARRGAVALAAAIANVHEVAVALDTEIFAVSLDELRGIAAAGGGDVLFEGMPPVASATARLEQFHTHGWIDFAFDRVEEIAEPVVDEGVFRLGALERFVDRSSGRRRRVCRAGAGAERDR
jgi:hypothetical protein